MAPRAAKKDKPSTAPTTPSPAILPPISTTTTTVTLPHGADFPAIQQPTRSPSMATIISENASTAASSPGKEKEGKTEKALKPKNEKAKVTKSTVEKKVSKAKVEKIEKGIAAADGLESKPKATKAKKAAAADDAVKGAGGAKGGGKDGERAEMVKKATGEEAERVMLGYLKEQNRPYNVVDLVANLRGRVTKTVADKLLREMEQNGIIKAKATNGDKKGSQWVFWALQDPADSAPPEELSAMDATITRLRETTLPPLKAQLKGLSQELSSILSSPSTADLSVLVANLQASNIEKRERLSSLKEMIASGRGIKKDEVEKAEKENKYWKTKLGARKKAFKELEYMLLENIPREELWEKLGLEDADLQD